MIFKKFLILSFFSISTLTALSLTSMYTTAPSIEQLIYAVHKKEILCKWIEERKSVQKSTQLRLEKYNQDPLIPEIDKTPLRSTINEIDAEIKKYSTLILDYENVIEQYLTHHPVIPQIINAGVDRESVTYLLNMLTNKPHRNVLELLVKRK